VTGNRVFAVIDGDPSALLLAEAPHPVMAALIADALNHGNRAIRDRLRRFHDARHRKLVGAGRCRICGHLAESCTGVSPSMSPSTRP
jgi:hypothetical protein